MSLYWTIIAVTIIHVIHVIIKLYYYYFPYKKYIYNTTKINNNPSEYLVKIDIDLYNQYLYLLQQIIFDNLYNPIDDIEPATDTAVPLDFFADNENKEKGIPRELPRPTFHNM